MKTDEPADHFQKYMQNWTTEKCIQNKYGYTSHTANEHQDSWLQMTTATFFDFHDRENNVEKHNGHFKWPYQIRKTIEL